MSKRKLLLADDSVTIQKVINLTFADEGIEVVTVGNGSAAIEKLNEIAPDLVLADVHMPGLTGYEVCEQIRQTTAYQNIPVMLLVGSFEPFDEIEARRVGANDYLTKPFQSIRQLVQKVTSLLDSADANAGAPSSTLTAERNTNLGDDEMIETVSGSDFGQNSSFVIPAPIEQNRAGATADNQFLAPINDAATAVDEDQDQDSRPTAPLSYVDIQEISSFSSVPSPAIGNESVSSETDVYNQEILPEPSINFASPDYAGEPAEVFELDLDSASDNANGEASFDNFGSYEINDFSMTNQSAEISMADETALAQTTNNQLSSNVSDSSNHSSFDWQNSALQPSIEFSDSSILELDTVDSASGANQDDDSILDLGIETGETASDFATETEFDYQQEPFELNNASSVAFETASMPSASSATAAEQFSSGGGNVDTVIAQTSAQTMSEMNLQYSPEMIDAIAQKVVEKLSDKVIERIAWEIVPDKFDSLMRQYIENQNR